MDKAKLADRLAHRNQPAAPNGAAADAAVAFLNGTKLAEAARYVKSSRVCLLTWIRENYVSSDNVDQHTDHVRDLLAWADELDELRRKLEVKASILGK